MALTARTRTLAVSALVLATSTLLAAPALAEGSPDPSVAGQETTTMSAADALLVFVGIPAAVFLVVWLLVSAPGWTRGGRPSQADAWTGEPHVVAAGAAAQQVTSAGAGEAPEALGAGEPAEAVVAGEPAEADGAGGTSARW